MFTVPKNLVVRFICCLFIRTILSTGLRLMDIFVMEGLFHGVSGQTTQSYAGEQQLLFYSSWPEQVVHEM